MNEDFIPFELAVKLRKKGFRENCIGYYDYAGEFHYNCESAISNREIYFCHNKYDNIWHSDLADTPTISQVLKWLRKKNIDVEIEAATGMLGIKVYIPYICTYTEFTLETSPDVIRYRQKKFSPTARLPHEIIPAHVHFKKWEDAALVGIEYVLDNLI